MHINTSRRDMLAQMIDIIAIKSGIIISLSEVINILRKEKELIEDNDEQWWEGDVNGFVRVEVTEVEQSYIQVMKHIGAFPDYCHPIDIIIKHVRQNPDIHKIDPNNRSELIKRINELNLRLMFGDPEPELEDLVTEFRRRHMMNMAPISHEWNGKINLKDLFKSEEIPENTIQGQYFDQRYIDYLAAQVEELDQIHWRQFEYLTAEYFKRNGYTVEVTPPRGDGGIDIYARKESNIAGPELIIIQCKRYGENNKVKIEEVKALYTDMQERDATRGIIITTSYLEKNAREFCEAKKYRLTRVENEHVVKLIREMSNREKQV